jgi:hypothetical protein
MCVVLQGGSVRAAEPFLVKDGRPCAQIVIDGQPRRMARLAAEELQSGIEKMTGAKLPIVTPDAMAEGAVRVCVGRSAETDRLKVAAEGLKYGAFRMVSGPDWLALLGNDEDYVPREPYNRSHADYPATIAAWGKVTGQPWGYPHGNLYKEYNPKMKIWERDGRGSFNAVTELLRMQGMRWYLPDPLGEIVPQKTSIALPQVDRTVRPDFAVRFLYQYGRMFAHEGATRDEVLWQLRLGLDNGDAVVGVMEAGLSHGINPVHNQDAVKKAHPEYYLLAGGKRDTEQFGGGRPCLSSQGLFEQNVKYVRAVYDILAAPLVSVMPQDGYVSLCQCDLCKGKDTLPRGWNGQISDYVWDYTNRVAKEVRKSHPDRKVSCFAYGTYLLPPERIETLSPNVLVGICQHRRLFYDAAERRKFDDLRKGWLAKLPEGSKQLIIWDYYIHAHPRSNPYMPFFFPHAISSDLRSLKGISVGDAIEVYRDPKGMASLGVDHLNLYVTARMWWDAGADVDALLEEYYTLYYGPAREEMKAFISYCEANFEGLDKNAAKIDRVFELLAAGRAKAPAGSVYEKRIAMIADYLAPLRELRAQLSKGRGDVPEAMAFDRNKADIVLDGKLDDKFWEGLRVYSLAELQTARAPMEGSTFKVAWAGDALYFGIRCDERDMKGLNVGTTRNEDTNLWNGDCIEILIETQTHSYYQIAVSPSGVIVDLDRKKGLNTLWSSGAQAAVFAGEGFWSLEVRVPVAGPQQEEVDPLNGLCGRKPNDVFPWYFNLCRQRIRPNGKEFTAFSPTGVDHFHELLKFAKLYVR